jgi:aminoglycoside phosphotransferase (APT) family kinase protein
MFDPALLAELVRAHVDMPAATLHFSPVNTGKHNHTFWVDSPRGRFVLRIAPPDDAGFLFYERRMMHQEPALHYLIRAHTNLPVAQIVGFDFSRILLDRDYVLMTALPGAPLSEAVGLTRNAFDRALFQVGGYLRHLHALTAPTLLGVTQYGYLGDHRPLEPQPTWAQAFTVMWHKLIDDVVACGSYTPAEGQLMRDLLELHRHHFDHPVTPCLLHMDMWSQNILVDAAGQVTGLVDFDRALWGDVEIEFAVLDYCGISEPVFWEGYGAARDESSSAMIRRQFYLLYEVQKYMPIRVWRRNNPAAAQQYKQHSFALAMQLVPE